MQQSSRTFILDDICVQLLLPCMKVEAKEKLLLIRGRIMVLVFQPSSLNPPTLYENILRKKKEGGFKAQFCFSQLLKKMSSFRKFDVCEESFNNGSRISECTEFSIFFRTLTGAAHPLWVTHADTGQLVKEKIFEMHNIHMDQQTLLFRGKVIQDTHTLADYNIGKESIITLITREEKKTEQPEPTKFGNKKTRTNKPTPPPKVFALHEEKATPFNRLLIFGIYITLLIYNKVKADFYDPCVAKFLSTCRVTKNIVYHCYLFVRNIINVFGEGFNRFVSPCLTRLVTCTHTCFRFFRRLVVTLWRNYCEPLCRVISDFVENVGSCVSSLKTHLLNLADRAYHYLIKKPIIFLTECIANWCQRLTNATEKSIQALSCILRAVCEFTIYLPLQNAFSTISKWTKSLCSALMRGIVWLKNLMVHAVCRFLSICIIRPYEYLVHVVSLICAKTISFTSSLGKEVWRFFQLTCTFLHDNLLQPIERLVQYLFCNTRRFTVFIMGKTQEIFVFMCTKAASVLEQGQNVLQYLFNHCIQPIHGIMRLSKFLWNAFLRCTQDLLRFIFKCFSKTFNIVIYHVIIPFVESFVLYVEDIFDLAVSSLKLVDSCVQWIRSQLVSLCKIVYRFVVNPTVTLLSSAGRKLCNYLSFLFRWIQSWIQSCATCIRSAVISATNWMHDIFTATVSALKSMLQSVQAFLGKLYRAFTSALRSLGNTIQRACSFIYDNTSSVCHWLLRKFTQSSHWIYSNCINPVCRAFTYSWTQIRKFVENVWSSSARFCGTAIRLAKTNCAIPLWNFLCNITRTTWNSFCGALSVIQRKSKSIINQIGHFINSSYQYISAPLYRGVRSICNCSNAVISYSCQKAKQGSVFVWRYIVANPSILFYRNVIRPIGIFAQRVTTSLFSHSGSLYRFITSPFAFIGNQTISLWRRYVILPFMNSYIAKTILWVLYGEQRYIQEGSFGLDIRPAVMIRREQDTMYRLHQNQEYSVWIKNFSETESLCTLSINGAEIGNFRLLGNKSYLIEHPGDSMRFRFNWQNENEGCTVEAKFAPKKTNNSIVPETKPKHTPTNFVSSHTKQEREYPVTQIVSENHAAEVQEQVECISFNGSKGPYSKQTFQTLNENITWDQARTTIISTTLHL